MAAGDIISDIVSVAGGGGNVNFQPAAGVEIVLTNFSWQGTSSGVIIYYLDDGTNSAMIFRNVNMGDPTGVTIKAGITNTNYLRMHNSHASARVMAYTGIQTK